MKPIAVFATILWLATGLSASAQDYLLKPGDRIDVSVLEDPGLNRQLLIRPDGKVSLPLAGTLQAADRTPEALQTAIRRALSRDFVEPPTVTVSVIDVAEEDPIDEEALITIYVIGEVGQPGRYDVETPIDLLQALALSGGPGVFAARDRVQVRRRASDGESVMLFDYEQIEDGATPAQFVALEDGDVIVVPERGLFD